MTREFQIRITNDKNEQLDCICYTSLAEANAAYNTLLGQDTKGATYHLELVEVLRQDDDDDGLGAIRGIAVALPIAMLLWWLLYLWIW